ncbi:hypothetical protein [Adhaeribacter pallidiroseus]|uniref:Uncharacterized protein n=1 Tax=Adhaeribacter pallidiroseus TaxID=2072847 RepID=A0A369QD08_9BACT|nr:hypothetical protein [Adhaeribacter pallidiroseus]RDC62793.1 hypothetical protein AHMF7616_01387 [Adhaeribacter pallidiroseus]
MEDLKQVYYLLKSKWNVKSFEFLQTGYWDTDRKIKSIDLTDIRLEDENSEKEEGYLYLIEIYNTVKIEVFNKSSFYLIESLHQNTLTLSCYSEYQQKEAYKVFTFKLEK